MELYEIEGFLRGKCLPGDLLVGESNAQYLTRKLNEGAEAKAKVTVLNQQVVNLATENASLKSNLMFWDADNPELPYDSPEEIASECELNYNEELVVQVAAKLPNRTYRVCESWETDCKLELVEGAELQTPATDAAIANIQAQGVDKLATFAGKEYQRFAGDKTLQRKWKGIVLLCTDFASQLRKEASNG